MAILARTLVWLGLVLACAFAGLAAYGPEAVWEKVGGPADQGAADIRNIERRSHPTDSLACSQGLCSRNADIVLRVYAEPPEALMLRLDKNVLVDPNVTRVDGGGRPAYRRYVARTPLMRFPDTIDALALPHRGGTGLELYSRSLLGRGDWGANRARLKAWIAALEK